MFSHSVVFDSWTAARLASLSFTISQSLLKLISIEWMMPSNHLILCCPLLLPSIFASIMVFSNESALHHMTKVLEASASASVLPMNIKDWFPLGLTGLISLQSKGLSRVLSSTMMWKHCLLFSPTLISMHDYWKNCSFDYTDLCWQSDVSALEYAI